MFSVVIPLYNKEYSIVNCLRSVFKQTFLPLEVIVINDGSTDSSQMFIEKEFSDQIERGFLKLVCQSNKGVSVARNLGVRLANSELICFLDADDEWMPDFLSRMIKLIRDFPEANMYSLAHVINKEGKGVYKPKHGLPNNHRGYVENFFVASARGSVVNSSKVCVRRQAFLNIGGFPEGVVAGEDLYLWIRLAMEGAVANEMSYLAIVNQRDDSSREGRKNSVPYPLVYFSEKKGIKRNLSLNGYLSIIFIKHFLRSLSRGNYKESMLRIKVFLRMWI